MNDHNKKRGLHVPVKLGVSDYTRIKIQERPRVWLPGAPVAEVTKLVWIIFKRKRFN